MPISKTFYELNQNSHLKDIDHEIYDFICENFRTQRRGLTKPYTFRLNQQISNMVRDQMLLELENLVSDYRLTGTESKFYSDRQKSSWPNILEELERLKIKIKDEIDTDRSFFGFPLNMPFTTLQDVW
jgi:hypothetical protein